MSDERWVYSTAFSAKDPKRLPMFHFEGDLGGSACSVRTRLYDDTARIVDDVPESRRCQRQGCRQLWESAS